MATFVIVHGGWGGGWEWTPVARALRAKGHEVFTPTLTGLGEREHVGDDVGLSQHVDDVVGVIRFEELRDVVLCGQSYGGMVITGVADAIPDRVRQLIYLDALVPSDGQSVQELEPELVAWLVQLAGERDDGRAPIPTELLPAEGSLPDQRRESYVARLRPHPVGTMTDALALTGAGTKLPRAFVRCTGGDDDDSSIAGFAAHAREAGWPYREIATPHDLQLYDPDGTATILHELASSAS